MSITFISTIKNEEYTLVNFLDSLIGQTRLPDEIIIVDGGSMDNTLNIMQNYVKKNTIQCDIKLLSIEGNIAMGRNLAIRNASYDYIAVSDAGCILNKNWLQNLYNSIKNDFSIDVVYGFFLPIYDTLFEKCVADLTYPNLNKINVNEMFPTSKSILFKKECWEKVNGYPEWLDAAEDNIFIIELRKQGCVLYFEKAAVVYWKPRKNIFELYNQYYNYTFNMYRANLKNYIFNSYGKNSSSYLLNNVIHIINDHNYKELLYVPIIIMTILVSKIIASLSYKLKHKL